MKGFFNGKKVKLNQPKPSPRNLADITKELNNECWALGQLEYQIYVLQQESERKNKKIQELNFEGASRKELDAKNKPQESTDVTKT
jgi:hypothetical protein